MKGTTITLLLVGLAVFAFIAEISAAPGRGGRWGYAPSKYSRGSSPFQRQMTKDPPNGGDNGQDSRDDEAPMEEEPMEDGEMEQEGEEEEEAAAPEPRAPLAWYNEKHIHGGSYQMTFGEEGEYITEKSHCHLACSANDSCQGFDWSRSKRQCFLHYEDSECLEMIYKPDCEHTRFVECKEDAPTDKPTEPPTTTMMTTSTPVPTMPTTPKATTAAEEEPVFEVMKEGYHVQGAKRIASGVEKEMCMQKCMEDVECAGFDYESDYKTCWAHTADTICKPLIKKESCSHYKRVACESDEDVANHFPSVFLGHHVQGGDILCDNCGRVQCQVMCLDNDTCEAVDYNKESHSCWIHTSETSCNELQPFRIVTHYRRKVCEVEQEEEEPKYGNFFAPQYNGPF